VRTLPASPGALLSRLLAAATPARLPPPRHLLALFWPELDQEHALRTASGAPCASQRPALGVVVGRGMDPAWTSGKVWSDCRCLERAIAAGEPLEAMDLYRGPLLEGFFISDAPDFERCSKPNAPGEDAASARRGHWSAVRVRGNSRTARTGPGSGSHSRRTMSPAASLIARSTAMVTAPARSRP